MNQIDCKWYRTLVYLYKRNISVLMNDHGTYLNECNLSILAKSPSIMSRCFNTINNDHSDSVKEAVATEDLPQTKNSTAQFQNEQFKFDFRIEPELNQVLIEGDILELTCKLKRFEQQQNTIKSLKKKNTAAQFYKSTIKWFLNERQHLTVSTIYYNKDNPTQIQIFETKNRFGAFDIIESKLVIGNTLAAQNSGNYRCVASAFSKRKADSERATLNTSWVEIKILNKIDLKNIEAINKKEKDNLSNSRQSEKRVVLRRDNHTDIQRSVQVA
jgi:hypothetical protein